MPDLVLDLIVDRVDLVDDGANSAAFIQMFKRREHENNMDFNAILAEMKPEHAAIINDVVAKAKAEVPEETVQELETAKEAVAKAEEKYTSAFDESETMKSKLKALEDAQKPKEPDYEEVLKSLSPEMQTVFKRMQTQKEQAENMAKELSAKAEHEEAVAKAATIKAIPVDEAQLIAVAKSASEEVMEVLKAASKAIEEAVPFEEVGKNRKDTSATSKSSEQAWAELEKHADRISVEQGVTKAAAVGIATKQYRDLYKQYLDGGAN
ncbi:hypothetical protein D3C75_232880 [compost metagenome]